MGLLVAGLLGRGLLVVFAVVFASIFLVVGRAVVVLTFAAAAAAAFSQGDWAARFVLVGGALSSAPFRATAASLDATSAVQKRKLRSGIIKKNNEKISTGRKGCDGRDVEPGHLNHVGQVEGSDCRAHPTKVGGFRVEKTGHDGSPSGH